MKQTNISQTQRNMLRNMICPILDGLSADTTKYVQLWTTFQQIVHSIRQIPRSMSKDGFPADAKEYPAVATVVCQIVDGFPADTTAYV